MDLFTKQLEEITWMDVRDKLPLDEPNRPWTVAITGPWTLCAYAMSDQDSTLDEFTSEEESPELYAKERSGNLWPLGIIVEICVNGMVLGRDSIWSVWLDISSGTTERDDYCYILDLIKQLNNQASADVADHLGRKIRDLQYAANVLVGIDEPRLAK
jgi:hypothetical protein